jgi:phosphoesterase RecJ-like protein
VSDWTPAWETNTDAAEIAAVLRAAKRVVCVTHSKPDGDAAGSAIAAARAMRRIGVDASVCFIGPAPRWLGEFAASTPIRVEAPGKSVRPSAPGSDPDVVVVTDTGSWSQLAEVADWLKERRDRTVVIDHHLHGDGGVARRRYIQTKDAATTQVLAPICAALLGVPVAEFPADVAEALYLGLATDTQWFRLSNVSPGTLRLAGDLLSAGVDHTRLYEMIEQRDTASRWKLLGRALSTLELHDDGRLAIMQLTLRDFDEAVADRNDTAGFADMVLHIASVRVAVVLTEADVPPGNPPATKVSMRSKPGHDAVDVNAATRQLGGGGHARAAGAKMPGIDLPEARRRVLAVLAAPAAKNVG